MFAAFSYFGMVLSVFLYQSYYNILQDTIVSGKSLILYCWNGRTTLMSGIDLIKKFATWVLEMAKYTYEITNEMWAVVWKVMIYFIYIYVNKLTTLSYSKSFLFSYSNSCTTVNSA